MEEEILEATARSSVEEKGEQKEEGNFSGYVARRGSER